MNLKSALKFITALCQVGVILGMSIFMYFGFCEHLRGNRLWLSSLNSAKNFRETRFLKGLLVPHYPFLESLHFVSNSQDGTIEVFKFKQKNKIPLMAIRIQKEIPCASCGDLDLLLVTDFKGTIQKLHLGKQPQIDGKTIDTNVFLKQFEGKNFSLPIQIGKDVEILKDAPSYSGAAIDAVSEALTLVHDQRRT